MVRYCKDISAIENYELAKADNFKGWICHHKLEMFFTAIELIKMDRYYNVPARELIYLRAKEHTGVAFIHKSFRNRKFSEEHKKHLSESHKGQIGANKGKHWYTNGKTRVMAFECPEGFYKK